MVVKGASKKRAAGQGNAQRRGGALSVMRLRTCEWRTKRSRQAAKKHAFVLAQSNIAFSEKLAAFHKLGYEVFSLSLMPTLWQRAVSLQQIDALLFTLRPCVFRNAASHRRGFF